jgi:hypothetical protein
MEPLVPIPFPAAAEAAQDIALNEVDVAIAMVSRGAAVRVRVAGMQTSIADEIAGVAAAHAGQARIRFVVERSPSGTTFTVGPRA